MQKADLIRQIELKFAALNPVFDERVRRQWAAAEAMGYGWGGVTAVSHATGLSIDTIRKGVREQSLRDTELVPALEHLVAPATRGDPQSPLCWTCKSTGRLAKEIFHDGGVKYG